MRPKSIPGDWNRTPLKNMSFGRRIGQVESLAPDSLSVRKSVNIHIRKPNHLFLMFQTPERSSCAAISPNDNNKTVASPRQQRKMDKLSSFIDKLNSQKRSQSNSKNTKEKYTFRQHHQIRQPPPPPQPENESEDDIKPLYLKGTISPVGEECDEPVSPDDPPIPISENKLSLPNDKNYENMVSFMKKLLTTMTKRKPEPQQQQLPMTTQRKKVNHTFATSESKKNLVKANFIAFEESAPRPQMSKPPCNLTINSTAREIRPTNLTIVQTMKKSGHNKHPQQQQKVDLIFKKNTIQNLPNSTKAGNSFKISFDSYRSNQQHSRISAKAFTGKTMKKIPIKQSQPIIIQNGVILMPGSGIRINSNRKAILSNTNRLLTPETISETIHKTMKPSLGAYSSSSKALLETDTNTKESNNYDSNKKESARTLRKTVSKNGTRFDRLRTKLGIAQDEPMNLIPMLKVKTEIIKWSIPDVCFMEPGISYDVI